MKHKTSKQIFKTGRPEDLDADNVVEIVSNLYEKGLAEAWFVGMEWPEGYHYCANPEYLRKTYAPNAIKNNRRAIWFACKFLD